MTNKPLQNQPSIKNEFSNTQLMYKENIIPTKPSIPVFDETTMKNVNIKTKTSI